MNTFLLEKSLTLYEKILQIQMDEQVHLGIFQNMCLVNNLAMVHLALKNERKSRECLDYVLSDIIYLLECDCEGRTCHNLDGFIENTIPLILSDSVMAPAA